MRSVPRSFWHEFRGAFARLPVWLPGTRLGLGDIGLLDPGGWSPVSTLAEQGITHRSGPRGAPVDYAYRSMDGTEVVTEAAGQAPAPVGRGSARYRFSRQGAFVLHASAVRARQIADLGAVAEQVLAAYRAGRWSREWLVVTELAVAHSALILVAAQAGAEATIEVGAGPGFPGDPGPVFPGTPGPAAGADAVAGPGALLGAALGIRLASEHGLAASLLSPEPATLMWAGRYIRDPRVGRTSFDLRGPSGPPGAGEPAFVELTAAPTALPAGPA